MKRKTFLGIDIGTTRTNAALISLGGEIIAFSSSRYDLINPAPFYYERNPCDWWNAVKVTFSVLQGKVDFRNIEILSIGVCGQTPTFVFVDKKGDIVRPAIIWKDSRAQKEALYLKEVIGEKLMEKFIGIRLPIEATWPPARLLWLKKYESDILRSRYISQQVL